VFRTYLNTVGWFEESLVYKPGLNKRICDASWRYSINTMMTSVKIE